MIVNIRHTAIVVSNIKKSRFFYESIGFTTFASKVEKGDFIDQLTGIDNVILEWVKLRSKDGFILELLQYHTHNDQSSFDVIPPNRIGYSHIAITVENVDDSCDRIKSLGGRVINSPSASEDGRVKLAYCYDTEGMLLEIVEEL
jgi:lactoylglutathione lyase